MPDATRDESAAGAARRGRSLQEYLRKALIELAARPDPEALASRIADRKGRTGSKLPAEKILDHLDAGRQ